VRLSKGGGTWEFKGVQAEAVELVQAEAMDSTLFQVAKGWVIHVCSKDE